MRQTIPTDLTNIEREDVAQSPAGGCKERRAGDLLGMLDLAVTKGGGGEGGGGGGGGGGGSNFSTLSRELSRSLALSLSRSFSF